MLDFPVCVDDDYAADGFSYVDHADMRTSTAKWLIGASITEGEKYRRYAPWLLWINHFEVEAAEELCKKFV